MDGHSLGCFDHITRLDALCTHDHFFDTPLVNGTNALQVGIESPFGHIMSMADVASNDGFLSAQITHFRHGISSPLLFFQIA